MKLCYGFNLNQVKINNKSFKDQVTKLLTKVPILTLLPPFFSSIFFCFSNFANSLFFCLSSSLCFFTASTSFKISSLNGHSFGICIGFAFLDLGFFLLSFFNFLLCCFTFFSILQRRRAGCLFDGFSEIIEVKFGKLWCLQT